jgi:hypothetical protein
MEDPTTNGYNDSTAGAGSSYNRQYTPGLGTFQYGGLQAPDFVGALAVTQAWGSAQLSAIAHQDYGSTAAIGSKWGYGVQAGVKFNLPQFGAGDFAGIMGAYAVGDQGALDTNYSIFGSHSTVAAATSAQADIGQDATWSAASGLKQTKGYSITAGFTHFFSPKLELDTGLAVLRSDSYAQTGLTGYGNATFTQYEASVDLRWKPVTGFEVLPYLEYRTVNLTGGTKANTGLVNNYNFDYGLRLTRSF